MGGGILTDAQRLIASLRNARLSWFEVTPGKRLQIIRPTEVEMVTGRYRTPVQILAEQVVGWEGFTEADILGPTIGSDSPAAFDPELFAAWVSDKAEQAGAVLKEIQRVQTDYLARREERSGN